MQEKLDIVVVGTVEGSRDSRGYDKVARSVCQTNAD